MKVQEINQYQDIIILVRDDNNVNVINYKEGTTFNLIKDIKNDDGYN